LFENLFIGAPSLSAKISLNQLIKSHYKHLPSPFQTLSNPALLPLFVLSHEGRIEVTFCILPGDPTRSVTDSAYSDGGGTAIFWADDDATNSYSPGTQIPYHLTNYNDHLRLSNSMKTPHYRWFKTKQRGGRAKRKVKEV
jgi:hypothetical protein